MELVDCGLPAPCDSVIDACEHLQGVGCFFTFPLPVFGWDMSRRLFLFSSSSKTQLCTVSVAHQCQPPSPPPPPHLCDVMTHTSFATTRLGGGAPCAWGNRSICVFLLRSDVLRIVTPICVQFSSRPSSFSSSSSSSVTATVAVADPAWLSVQQLGIAWCQQHTHHRVYIVRGCYPEWPCSLSVLHSSLHLSILHS